MVLVVILVIVLVLDRMLLMLISGIDLGRCVCRWCSISVDCFSIGVLDRLLVLLVSGLLVILLWLMVVLVVIMLFICSLFSMWVVVLILCLLRFGVIFISIGMCWLWWVVRFFWWLCSWLISWCSVVFFCSLCRLVVLGEEMLMVM